MSSQHYPVIHRNITGLFKETGQHWFIDCTLGMGGHSAELLRAFPHCRVMGLDVDQQSLNKARENLKEFNHRMEFHHLNFTQLFQQLDLKGKEISGILVDPGISIFQLKDGERGFSHSRDAQLDMRKDQQSELTAYDIIHSYNEQQLTEMMETYGEMRNAAGLAKKIKEALLFGSIDTTTQLAEIAARYYRWKPKKGRTHPAANLFQALRIVVNGELEGIDQFIEDVPQYLPTGARIAFLSFHSVEDRMVKKAFQRLKKEGQLDIIKPFPAFPAESEVVENLPSRSAKLRAGEVV